MPHRRAALALCATALAAAGRAVGEEPRWPQRAVTLVVPAPAGGAIDVVGRLLAQHMALDWGQAVAVENRPGDTGVTGTEAVARSAPDGYTLALVSSSHAINPSVARRLPYDPLASFAPVVLTHVVPMVLVVAATLPVATVAQLAAYVRARPGELRYASSGTGGAPHFSAELFRRMEGLDVGQAAYTGSKLAHPDLLAGRTAFMFDTLAASAAPIAAGSLRALAVTTARRSTLLPGVPTMQEAGLAGFDTASWGGLLAPAGTPIAVITRINTEANRILRRAAVRRTLREMGIEPGGGSAAQFAMAITREMRKWATLARSAGIAPD